MKILLLVQKEQRVILDRLYDGIARHVGACGGECDIRRLDSAQQADLRRYFNEQVDVAQYDRIVFFLRFKKEMRQWRFIRTVPNLVILEHDACQNYMGGKYHGKYARHYRRMPWARIIVSGHHVAEQLRAEGFDAVFVSKGYDQQVVANLHRQREIELGFVGSLGSSAYHRRKAFLQSLAAREALEIVTTAPGRDYVDKLNTIRFFVSADIGIGEYMIKNFEAMAAGCVLFAFRQGHGEEGALGFVDMENVVLYADLDECCRKIAQLRADPALVARIAAAGQRLAEQQYRFDVTGRQIAAALQQPLRKPQDYPLSWWRHIFG